MRPRIRWRQDRRTRWPKALGVTETDGWCETAPEDLGRGLHALTAWALDHDVDLSTLEVVRPSLEDVYLELTDGVQA